MRFYEIAVLSRPLVLTYSAEESYFAGDLVQIEIRSKICEGVVLKEVPKPPFECKKIDSGTDFYIPLPRMEIARFISSYYFCSIGEALALFVPFEKRYRQIEPRPLAVADGAVLSEKQKEALDFLTSRQKALLFGDTGSGKTEIYMELIAKTISKGKNAIFLMPEISLTPQMEKRLKSRFKEGVAIWHSKISKKRKKEILSKIGSGEIRVVAGPRSALFLPISRLGLIVVDEEHDDSYKSNSRPRYNAKDMAIYFAEKLGAKVVLGSATPSLSSYFKLDRFRLKGGYGFKGRRFLWDDRVFDISDTVFEKIEQTLKSKKQAIIFLPTRGNFKYLICHECASSVKCPYCDVGMSLHLDRNALMCHYCNFATKIPKVCPECGCDELRANRIGTSEVVSILRDRFKEAVIEKFDRDEITTHAKLLNKLKRFSQKKIDILVGTQMLSKGHDYPDVALSVVLGIDYLLNMPDFRARERAVSTLIQIAGRSGRKGFSEVIVQTKNKDLFREYLDYEKFLIEEASFRKGIYPPFVSMAAVNFSHKNSEIAKANMETVLERLKEFKEIEIMGHGPAPIEKIASKYRFQILLRSSLRTSLLKALHSCVGDLGEVDMDPVSVI